MIDKRGNGPRPALLVLSSLFPSGVRPGAGLFVRERMFRVAARLPVVVVSPYPWFPFQGLIRRLRPGFRPEPARRETQDGVEVYFPRFLSIPGCCRWLDGWSMALAARRLAARLRREGRADIIDSHFAYPDGYAAALLGRWLGIPSVVTLRGTEPRQSAYPLVGRLQRRAMRRVDRVIAVAGSLRDLALAEGVEAARVVTVGNGVDAGRFRPIPCADARARLDLPADAKVLVSVGALVERKGIHRVIEQLPALLREYPNLVYLVVGGGSPEGDWGERLREQVATLAVGHAVRFLGPYRPDDLHVPLSSADCFVLATRMEGWANVFLEAMACGLPVITTDVGGNREVVNAEGLGRIVPFGDPEALRGAIAEALATRWDRGAIRAYAKSNDWNGRVDRLVTFFSDLHSASKRGRGE